AAPSFPTGPQPGGTVVEDFNNDGIPDVAMADYDKPAGVYVLLGNGQGSFAFASSPLVGGDAHGLAAADFDGDGNIDMVVSSISNGPSDIVSVLRGHGDGTFDMPVEYSVGAFATAVRAADINGDGNADIVTANANGNSISVLLGVGD